jgi:hypothetical protein
MLGRADHGFVDINAMALNAAISGSILAVPDACLVIDGIASWLNTGVAYPLGLQAETAAMERLVSELVV